jgi:hypothetical protein
MTATKYSALLAFLGFVVADVGLFLIYRPMSLVAVGVVLILAARAGLRA